VDTQLRPLSGIPIVASCNIDDYCIANDDGIMWCAVVPDTHDD